LIVAGLDSRSKVAFSCAMVKHAKRPRDFSQAAKLVVDIASGAVQDRDLTPEEQGKDPAAAALGRKGGKARAVIMSAAERSKIARGAALKRWGK
jgi:hypothetical protein